MRKLITSLVALIVASFVLSARAEDSRQGKLGEEVATAQWIFQVRNITQTDEYTEQYYQEGRVIRPTGKKDTLIVIEARLKNRLEKTQSPVLTERKPGNTGLIDEEGRSYQPLDFDARQLQDKIRSYEAAPILPGAVADFALVFSVPKGTKPKTLNFTCSTYLGAETDVQVSLTKQNGNAGWDLQIKEDKAGVYIGFLADVLFDFDKADIRPEAQGALKQAARMIAEKAKGVVRIEGHTDSKGSDVYNQELSKQRAEAVRNWLVQKEGLNQVEFVTEGFGSTRPVVPNTKPDGSDDPDGRQKNRRVEIIMAK